MTVFNKIMNLNQANSLPLICTCIDAKNKVAKLQVEPDDDLEKKTRTPLQLTDI